MDDLRASILALSRNQSHLSRSELATYQSPSKISTGLVSAWLADNGIESVSMAGPFVNLRTTVARADDMLETSLGWYRHESANASVLRARHYTIPASLRQHIDFIYPLTNFMAPARQPPPHADHHASQSGSKTQARAESNPCRQQVTPGCIKELYNWTYPLQGSSYPVRLAIAGFLGQVINYNDTGTFLEWFSPELLNVAPPCNFTVELLANATNPQYPRYKAGNEASLDVEYAMALGYPARVTYYNTGGKGVELNRTDGLPLPTEASNNEPYIDLLTHFLEMPDEELPHVLSISYADDEQSVPYPYAKFVCDLFMQLSARGMTVLAATGDSGAAGNTNYECRSIGPGGGRPMLIPTFPASCPYVTAVGATDNLEPDVVTTYSAGGFSNYFARPSWQDDAVEGYVRSLNRTKEGLYNQSGRAFPDISAIGSMFQIVFVGHTSGQSGTSASTPVVAAMVALANDWRFRQRNPAQDRDFRGFGWLNPFLYQPSFRAMVDDITKGVTYKCVFDKENDIAEPGWPALKGWDAATGIGVPKHLWGFIDGLINATNGNLDVST